jgi:hypothetical protein
MNNSNFGIRSLSDEEVNLIGGADGGVLPCPGGIIGGIIGGIVFGPIGGIVGSAIGSSLGCD